MLATLLLLPAGDAHGRGSRAPMLQKPIDDELEQFPGSHEKLLQVSDGEDGALTSSPAHS